MCAITSRYPAGLGDADSIYDSFLSVGISFHALIQPADTCLPVQYLVHLLYLVVPVRTDVYKRQFLYCVSFKEEETNASRNATTTTIIEA